MSIIDSTIHQDKRLTDLAIELSGDKQVTIEICRDLKDDGDLVALKRREPFYGAVFFVTDADYEIAIDVHLFLDSLVRALVHRMKWVEEEVYRQMKASEQ